MLTYGHMPYLNKAKSSLPCHSYVSKYSIYVCLECTRSTEYRWLHVFWKHLHAPGFLNLQVTSSSPCSQCQSLRRVISTLAPLGCGSLSAPLGVAACFAFSVAGRIWVEQETNTWNDLHGGIHVVQMSSKIIPWTRRDIGCTTDFQTFICLVNPKTAPDTPAPSPY